MDSGKLKEEQVLTKQYSNVCNTLKDVDNLLPHFVEENIITVDDLEEINTTIPSTKKSKAQKLLSYILGPLKAGNTHGFYMMLKIMKEHGNQATCELANRIKGGLPPEQPDQLANTGQPDHSALDRMSRLQPPFERNVNKLQFTRGMYIFGATLLFCFFIVVVLLTIILVIVTLIYFSAGKDEAMFYAKMICGHGIQELSPEFHTTHHNFVQQSSMLQCDTSDLGCATFHQNEDVRKEFTASATHEAVVSAPSNDLIAPVIFNISNFTAKMRRKERWFSDSFLAFEEGYNMTFHVCTAGCSKHNLKESHLSLYLKVVPGSYDDKLQLTGHFPLDGYFTLELISQSYDALNHHKHISPKEYMYSGVTRVYEGDKSKWWGISQFIFLDRIQIENYLKDDTIYFRISYSKYLFHAEAMQLMPLTPLILLFALCNGLFVFAILTVIEFVAFTNDKASILKPTCVDFSFNGMKLFLSTNQPLLMNTARCVFYNSVKDCLKVMLLFLQQVLLLAICELSQLYVDIPGFDINAAFTISLRIFVVGVHSLIFAISWEGTICMVNPVWCILLYTISTS